VLVSVRDITAQKEAERAVRESEEKFSRAFHDGVMAMAIVSEEERLVDVNDAMAELLSFTREELIGKRLEDLDFFVGDFALREHRSQVRQTLLEKGVVRNAEIQLRTSTGEIRLALFSASLLPLGGRANSICALFDITERKRFEDALRDSEERFRTAIVNSPFPALIHAEDGEVLAVSQSWTALSGYSEEELPTVAGLGWSGLWRKGTPDPQRHPVPFRSGRKPCRGGVLHYLPRRIRTRVGNDLHRTRAPAGWPPCRPLDGGRCHRAQAQ
jgi:PAS domain S-box-containing protein